MTMLFSLTNPAVEKRHRIPLVDRRPEETHYRDTGCELAPSCLQCPMERCVYDEPEGGRGAERASRDAEIYKLYREQRQDIQALAARFGVSRRTIHRAVARQGGLPRRTCTRTARA